MVRRQRPREKVAQSGGLGEVGFIPHAHDEPDGSDSDLIAISKRAWTRGGLALRLGRIRARKVDEPETLAIFDDPCVPRRYTRKRDADIAVHVPPDGDGGFGHPKHAFRLIR